MESGQGFPFSIVSFKARYEYVASNGWNARSGFPGYKIPITATDADTGDAI